MVRRMKNNNQGFTLLEVILSMSILAVGILSMGALQTSSVCLNNNASDITEAVRWASDKMEYLISLDYDSDELDADTYSETIDDFNVEWVITDDGPGTPATYKTITITITYSNLQSSGEDKAITFLSVKAQNV